MPELRKDPITGRWVIISTERGKRPNDFLRESVIPREEKNCPFCVGNEARTPPEILVYGRNGGGPNTPGWSIRVVPNKFPALGIEGELDREGEGLFDKMNGIGAHEVVIESPNHLATLASLPERAVEDVLWGYRDRMLDLKNDKRFRYILIFKNHGEAAGATIDHPHSQLIALPIVPRRVREGLIPDVVRCPSDDRRSSPASLIDQRKTCTVEGATSVVPIALGNDPCHFRAAHGIPHAYKVNADDPC